MFQPSWGSRVLVPSLELEESWRLPASVQDAAGCEHRGRGSAWERKAELGGVQA